MSIASETNRNNYLGNGSVKTYSYTFKIFNDDELLVTVKSNLDVETTLTLTTHYTVSGAGSNSGGSITLVNGAFDWIDSTFLKNGYTLSVRRNLELIQETDIRNQGEFFPEIHEDAFDRLTMQDQQQQDELDRTVKLSETADVSDFNPTLPVEIIGEINKVLMTNATGDGFEVGPSASTISGAAAYAAAAAASAAAALVSETNAAASETAAGASETNAAVSEAAAAASAAAAAGVVSAHEVDTTNIHGIADTSLLVTTTGTQALTNKDIDGGTASNTRRITLPKDTKTNLDALTRKQGTIVFDTTSNKPYYDDGSNLRVIGSGSGGAGNLIEDGDGEAGIANFIEGSYSAATRPSGTFTASSGSGAFSVSNTSSSLFGNTSLLLTKVTGASRQGRAIERTISIDSGYQAKVLEMRIDYEVVSGTFVAGSTSADSSLIWYIGQFNGSTWSYTEPSSFKMLSNSTSISDTLIGNFQTNADTTQIKLIAYVAETASSAWVVKCEVGIRPCNYVYGTPITDWQSYTPTVLDNSTNRSSEWSTLLGLWRRVGDSVEIKIVAERNSSASSGAGGSSYFTYPSGILPNAAVPNTAGLIISSLSNSRQYNTEVAAPGLWVIDVYATASLAYNNTNFPASSRWYIETPALRVPGWSSSTQVSDGYDGRKVNLKLSTNAGSIATSATTWTTITFSTPEFDDVAGWNGTDTYTFRTAGDYEIGLIAGQNSAAANYFRTGYRINSGTDVVLGQGVGKVGGPALPFGSTVIRVNAGDTLQFRAFTESTEGIGATRSAFVKKVLAPTTISATEVVAARYKTNTATSIPNTGSFVIIDFEDSESLDTHNAVTTGASWKFTAPVSGLYEVSATLLLDNASWTAGNAINMRLFKNGSQYTNLDRFASQATVTQLAYLNGTALIPLNAGDYIDIRCAGNQAVVVFNDNTFNHVNIKRVK